MKDSNNIDELYNWVNSRYEEYTNGDITEETYLADLEHYKKRLAELETDKEDQKVSEEKPERKSISPSNVRSTSIAGLRKKLMEEMKK